MHPLRTSSLLLLTLLSARADYLDDTGYRALQQQAGAALPDGSTVGVSQIEFGAPDYLPQAGSGTFAGTGFFLNGKSFTAKSGTSGASSHALNVAAHFYGLNQNPASGRASLVPGLTGVDMYWIDPDGGSQSWLRNAFLTPGSAAPLTETRAVQNHSWISDASAADAADDNGYLRRIDYAINRDGFLCMTGVNNGSTSAVPGLMCSAYHVIAVGVSSGNHSTGGTPSVLDGPGRIKPEIVAPLDATSYATALVSSAGALLRAKADTLTANATRPETLKAILLTGANTDKFPAWTNTPTVPLDTRFGAGELNVLRSWNILTAGERSPGSTPQPAAGWFRTSLTIVTTADCILTIPPGQTGVELSATAVWHRTITDSAPGPSFTPAVQPLANYDLALEHLTSSGAAATDTLSNGTLHNLEHIRRRHLPSGTWRLRLRLTSGSAVPASVAWHLTLADHHPSLAGSREGNQQTLQMDGLLTGQDYQIQTSPDLAAWSPATAFTASGPAFTWTDPDTAAGRRFYRLAAVSP